MRWLLLRQHVRLRQGSGAEAKLPLPLLLPGLRRVYQIYMGATRVTIHPRAQAVHLEAICHLVLSTLPRRVYLSHSHCSHLGHWARALSYQAGIDS